MNEKFLAYTLNMYKMKKITSHFIIYNIIQYS